MKVIFKKNNPQKTNNLIGVFVKLYEKTNQQ